MARWVLEEVVGLPSHQLSFDRFRILTTDQHQLLQAHLHRLQQHEPIQYVLGYAEFFGYRFKVNQDVLIPRPETETLLHYALERLPQHTLSVLDIGTGSGCLAIGCKKQRPAYNVTAVDISEAAIEVAKANAVDLNVSVDFRKMDILEEHPKNQYDVIFSNPPYIGLNEKKLMRDNVLRYEPHLALFSEDPLLFYKRIAVLLPEILQPGGQVFLELNEHYSAVIEQCYKPLGGRTEIVNDLYEKPRILHYQSKY